MANNFMRVGKVSFTNRFDDECYQGGVPPQTSQPIFISVALVRTTPWSSHHSFQIFIRKPNMVLPDLIP